LTLQECLPARALFIRAIKGSILPGVGVQVS
jgi:hypothetical protein